VTERGENKGFAQKAGAMFLFPVPYPAQLPFPDYFSDKVGLEKRTHPLITTPERVEVRTWLKIPEGVRVQLRQDVEVKKRSSEL